jgi:hypothetical protein
MLIIFDKKEGKDRDVPVHTTNIGRAEVGL